MKRVQLERLKAGVERLAANVPFYRVRFGEAGIDARNIRSFEELARLPFTTKADLLNNYAYLASRFPVRVRSEDNPSDVLRLGESAVVPICDNAHREPEI